MPIPTELIVTVGGIALAIAGAGIYSALTGNSASVDYDDDGTDEITFDGDSESGGETMDTEYEGDQAIDPAYNERIETEPSPYNNTPPEDGYGSSEDDDSSFDPNEEMSVEPPTSVQEIGEDLESITGIGPTRAEAFREAGFDTATDIWHASDSSLKGVEGIGPRAVEQIRSDVGSFDDDE